jgi:hypothetical protein
MESLRGSCIKEALYHILRILLRETTKIESLVKFQHSSLTFTLGKIRTFEEILVGVIRNMLVAFSWAEPNL